MIALSPDEIIRDSLVMGKFYHHGECYNDEIIKKEHP